MYWVLQKGLEIDETLIVVPDRSYGTSLVDQWLRLCVSIAGGTGSIPGQGTKISAGHEGQQKKKKIFNK